MPRPYGASERKVVVGDERDFRQTGFIEADVLRQVAEERLRVLEQVGSAVRHVRRAVLRRGALCDKPARMTALERRLGGGLAAAWRWFVRKTDKTLVSEITDRLVSKPTMCAPPDLRLSSIAARFDRMLRFFCRICWRAESIKKTLFSSYREFSV